MLTFEFVFQVQVLFSPRALGCYSQGWEVKSEMLGGGSSTAYSCQLYLTGQVCNCTGRMQLDGSEKGKLEPLLD